MTNTKDDIITAIGNLSERLDSLNKNQAKLLEKDSFRKKSDIRNIDVSKLAWYQKIQLKRVNQQIAEFENAELRIQIFETFCSGRDHHVEQVPRRNLHGKN
jgi:hypothetical protein